MTDEGEIPIIYLYIAYRLKLLRGRVKFPTGGKARELSHAQPIRCDSGADSTVWMREERNRDNNVLSHAMLSAPQSEAALRGACI